MATVVTPYTYTDGNVLVPADHNDNVYSTDAAEGIMSEGNGGLDANNLAVGFNVQQEHVHSEEVMRVRQEHGRETLDYVSDAFGDHNDDSGTGSDSYMAIAGCACRFNIPFNVSIALFQWSLFMSMFRFLPQDSAETVSPLVRIQAFLKDPTGAVTRITHTRRDLATTIYTSLAPAPYSLYSRESRNARHWDMSHLVDVAAGGLTAGFHELSCRLYMQRRDNNVVPSQDIIMAYNGTPISSAEHQALWFPSVRTTVGIRNARALLIL